MRQKTQLSEEKAPLETAKKLYLRGLVMNIANPKITIFFLAFLPQFVDPANGPLVPQFYQLGFLMMVTTIVTFGTVAMAAGLLGDWLKHSLKAQVWINRASGIVFVALAAKLALVEK